MAYNHPLACNQLEWARCINNEQIARVWEALGVAPMAEMIWSESLFQSTDAAQKNADTVLTGWALTKQKVGLFTRPCFQSLHANGQTWAECLEPKERQLALENLVTQRDMLNRLWLNMQLTIMQRSPELCMTISIKLREHLKWEQQVVDLVDTDKLFMEREPTKQHVRDTDQAWPILALGDTWKMG